MNDSKKPDVPWLKIRLGSALYTCLQGAQPLLPPLASGMGRQLLDQTQHEPLWEGDPSYDERTS